MSSAKELFEKLGYILDLNNSYCIGYFKRITETKIRTITFIKDYKYMSLIDTDNNSAITLQELQAINKQIEELHWNDTTINIDVKLDGKKVMEELKRNKQQS